ncbi:MAG TPA: lysophospholipid acyltransferase family protein [Pyrinomonadaceae bacterium]|nr:lysophospholipid acyltransferase family protein [Pyrinomonadaceae bacterium]
MTRRIIVALLRFALRVYFRRVEVNGLEHVPLKSPVIFVLNHPNALVDPAFLLCLAPRRVSFLAKAPLFKVPVLAFLIRALDSLPVYRHQDEGQDVSRNRETFTAASQLLARGGTIGICPEGVSHDEPGLRPIKTGAARIALGAVSTGNVDGLKIVPAGLYYTSKTKFRSAALLYFGKPIEVTPVALAPDGNPPRPAVQQLSRRIGEALREVMLDAEHEEALHTIARAERIFSADGQAQTDESLTGELLLQKQFIKAYRILRERAPQRLQRLELRMIRFEEQLRQAGIETDDLAPPNSTLRVFGQLVSRCLLFIFLIGPAALGAVIHYPAYRLSGYLATRFSIEGDDVISTVKIMSAMLFFPLTWLLVALAAYGLVGEIGLITLIVAPLCGYVTIRFSEELDRFLGGLRALVFFLRRRRFFVRMIAERNAIRSEILALGDEAAMVTR